MFAQVFVNERWIANENSLIVLGNPASTDDNGKIRANTFNFYYTTEKRNLPLFAIKIVIYEGLCKSLLNSA